MVCRWDGGARREAGWVVLVVALTERWVLVAVRITSAAKYEAGEAFLSKVMAYLIVIFGICGHQHYYLLELW